MQSHNDFRREMCYNMHALSTLFWSLQNFILVSHDLQHLLFAENLNGPHFFDCCIVMQHSPYQSCTLV